MRLQDRPMLGVADVQRVHDDVCALHEGARARCDEGARPPVQGRGAATDRHLVPLVLERALNGRAHRAPRQLDQHPAGRLGPSSRGLVQGRPLVDAARERLDVLDRALHARVTGLARQVEEQAQHVVLECAHVPPPPAGTTRTMTAPAGRHRRLSDRDPGDFRPLFRDEAHGGPPRPLCLRPVEEEMPTACPWGGCPGRGGAHCGPGAVGGTSRW
jgi:hypothetical protein